MIYNVQVSELSIKHIGYDRNYSFVPFASLAEQALGNLAQRDIMIICRSSWRRTSSRVVLPRKRVMKMALSSQGGPGDSSGTAVDPTRKNSHVSSPGNILQT